MDPTKQFRKGMRVLFTKNLYWLPDCQGKKATVRGMKWKPKLNDICISLYLDEPVSTWHNTRTQNIAVRIGNCYEILERIY